MSTLMIACLLHKQEVSVVQLKCAAKVIWEICLVGLDFSIAILPLVFSECIDVHVSSHSMALSVSLKLRKLKRTISCLDVFEFKFKYTSAQRQFTLQLLQYNGKVF